MNSSADKILTSVMQEVSLHLKKVKKKEKEKKKKKRKPPLPQKQNKTKNKKTKQLLKYQDVKPALISRYKAKP